MAVESSAGRRMGELALAQYRVFLDVQAERAPAARSPEAEVCAVSFKFFRASYERALALCLRDGFVPPWSSLN